LAYEVEYKTSVVHDFKKIDKKTAKRIIDKLEIELSKDPDAGTPLKEQFKGLFRYRVGDHRVIYTKTKNGVLILRVAHRKKVYKHLDGLK
jgi:mRNA interferase RelE/StbE